MALRSDEELIANYLSGGDEKALEILISRYLKPIYNFVFRYIGDIQDAEDITQEVFLKVWRNFKKFDKKKNFKTWIFTIAKNTATDFLRKKKTIPFSEFENDSGENILSKILASTLSLPNETFEHKYAIETLNSAIQKLENSYRTIISFRYNENLTFKEIAEILGEPLNTIKSRYRRALIQLKKILS